MFQTKQVNYTGLQHNYLTCLPLHTLSITYSEQIWNSWPRKDFLTCHLLTEINIAYLYIIKDLKIYYHVCRNIEKCSLQVTCLRKKTWQNSMNIFPRFPSAVASLTGILFVFLILYVPVNNFSVMQGLIFLDWTSAKQRIKFFCLFELILYFPSTIFQL